MPRSGSGGSLGALPENNAWLVGWLAGWLANWLVGRSVDRLVG